jgi:RHH-type proline utilization regulon transcriptional repressor/proline dehydrogenase/delta 1-pyrroline-5-carboxylate dehydrogenase
VLIAETGGMNAMIVDSSSLPEQVVADALSSAFDSAGQRCSALRVLCIQNDVAPVMLAMLEGAMRELTVGDPRRLATDIGPVIDADARAPLLAHSRRDARGGPQRRRDAARAGSRGGTFVAPTLIDLGGIDGLGALRRETFGPILHVMSWERDELPSSSMRSTQLDTG